jgi:2-oxoglutarate ferredoxin oxidoreductase subunit alpha
VVRGALQLGARAVVNLGAHQGVLGALQVAVVGGNGFLGALLHLRHLNPFPADLGEVLRRYDRVICPEMNLGQLSMLLRAKYLVDVESHTQVRGLPFRAAELAAVVQDVIDSTGGTP